jgi:hypothetical protein
MITDIQGYKYNMYKDNNNNFTFKSIIIFIFVFIIFFASFFYYYIIIPKKTVLEGFIFGTIITAIWDGCLFLMFDKGVSHSAVLLYDTFIVGGLAFAIPQYIIYNYYDILKKYIFVLFVLYLLSLVLFFYSGYKYNPDLSNIKGIVLF